MAPTMFGLLVSVALLGRTLWPRVQVPVDNMFCWFAGLLSQDGGYHWSALWVTTFSSRSYWSGWWDPHGGSHMSVWWVSVVTSVVAMCLSIVGLACLVGGGSHVLVWWGPRVISVVGPTCQFGGADMSYLWWVPHVGFAVCPNCYWFHAVSFDFIVKRSMCWSHLLVVGLNWHMDVTHRRKCWDGHPVIWTHHKLCCVTI